MTIARSRFATKWAQGHVGGGCLIPVLKGPPPPPPPGKLIPVWSLRKLYPTASFIPNYPAAGQPLLHDDTRVFVNSPTPALRGGGGVGGGALERGRSPSLLFFLLEEKSKLGLMDLSTIFKTFFCASFHFVIFERK